MTMSVLDSYNLSPPDRHGVAWPCMRGRGGFFPEWERGSAGRVAVIAESAAGPAPNRCHAAWQSMAIWQSVACAGEFALFPLPLAAARKGVSDVSTTPVEPRQ